MDSLDWNRKIALKEIFIETLRNVDNMVASGLKPNILPDMEKMAKILEIPVNTFDEEVTVPEDDEKFGDRSNIQDPNQDPNAQRPGQGDTYIKTRKDKDGNVVDIKTVRKQKKAPSGNTRKTSFKGTREVERKVIKPGSSRADKIRAKLSDPELDIDAFTQSIRDLGYVAVYEPIPDEEGNISQTEKTRYEIIKGLTTEEGVKNVKAALLRLKIWSGMDMLPNFEFMSPEELVRKIYNDLLDFHIDILYEAMSRKLSEEEDEEFKKKLDSLDKEKE
jgi:hypothetical protein